MGCTSKALTGEASRIVAAPSGFGDKCPAAISTQVSDKRLVDVLYQIRATVAPAVIIILVDVKYQPVHRSIEIFHFAQVGRTEFLEVFRTRPMRTWIGILVKSMGKHRVKSVLTRQKNHLVRGACFADGGHSLLHRDRPFFNIHYMVEVSFSTNLSGSS